MWRRRCRYLSLLEEVSELLLLRRHPVQEDGEAVPPRGWSPRQASSPHLAALRMEVKGFIGYSLPGHLPSHRPVMVVEEVVVMMVEEEVEVMVVAKVEVVDVVEVVEVVVGL